MKNLFFYATLVLFLSFAHGTKFWDALETLIKDTLDFAVYNDTDSYPSNPLHPPNPKFPLLKLYVYDVKKVTDENNQTYRTIYEIDPANLFQFTAELNKRPTVIFAFGYLDHPVKVDLKFKKFTETTAMDVFWAYFFHGWLLGHTYADIGQTYPRETYHNFIIVDWSAYNQEYFSSLCNLTEVADVIGDVLFEMSTNPIPLNLTNLYFIGHSLGAHIVGLMARRIKHRVGGVFGVPVIPRVTGLDPAGPFINFPIVSYFFPHLEKEDAQFVDIIHTDAGVCGTSWSVGHIDFWPNNGNNQPGCPRNSFFDFVLRQNSSCSHMRAVELFAESVISYAIQKSNRLYAINKKSPPTNYFDPKFYNAALCTKTLFGLECKNTTTLMGFEASQFYKFGNYYLVTDSQPAYYALGENGTLPYLTGTANGGELSFN